MYLSNTSLSDGTGISSIYYIRYNYMFQRLTKAIFRLYMKYFVSSYTRLIICLGSGEVGGEVGTRSCMCHGGLVGWVNGVSAIMCMYELIIVRSMVSYYVCCRNYMYIYIYIYLSYACTHIHVSHYVIFCEVEPTDI